MQVGHLGHAAGRVIARAKVGLQCANESVATDMLRLGVRETVAVIARPVTAAVRFVCTDIRAAGTLASGILILLEVLAAVGVDADTLAAWRAEGAIA